MKKILLLLLLMVMTISGLNAQIKTCCYFDGFWSDWKRVEPTVQIWGNWDGFFMYDSTSGGKWDPQFKFTIHNFSVPNKKQRKKDVKAKLWYEFEGTVEYNLPEFENTSILYWFQTFKEPNFMDKSAIESNEYRAKKIVSKAIIKVYAFEKKPSTYNIYFDKVGVGISLNAPNWKEFD